MHSHMRIADLSNQDGQQSFIRFRTINSSSVERAERDIGILGFYIMSDGALLPTATDDHSTCDDKYHKAFSKGKRASIRVMQLLNGWPQRMLRPSQTTEFSNAEMNAISACDIALVGGPPCKGHARDMEGISSFQKIDFQFSNTSSTPENGVLSSSQYLHFSCPSLKANESPHTEHEGLAFDSVEIVSGMCLFSAEILSRSVLKDGRIDVQKLLYPKPTLYEMEFVARSSSTIADTASTIVSRGKAFHRQRHHGSGVPVRITLDVPSFHYYQAIDEQIDRGLCTATEALRWMEAIELRYDQIAAVFEKSVRHELHQRGQASSYNCEIRVTPRASLVAASIRQALQDGERPSLASILQRLNGQKDRIWQDFYQLLPPKDRPETFRALGYLFYVFQVVKPALVIDKARLRRWSSPDIFPEAAPRASTQIPPFSQAKVRPRRLIISIDDGAERRIYSRAQKLLKKIRNSPDSPTYPTLVEMYMCRRVFINSNESGSNLYLGDPSFESPTLFPSFNNDYDLDSGLCPLPGLEPVNVVRHLYGSQRGTNLQRWFKEVGL